MSIGKRLMIPIMIVLVLGLSIMAFWINELSRKALTTAILQYQHSEAEGAARAISLQLGGYQYALEQTAISQYIVRVLQQPEDSTLVQHANERLGAGEKALPGVSMFTLINAQGLATASSSPETIGKLNVADRAYFQEAMQGRFVFSKASLSRTTGQPSFFVAAPVRIQGNVAGVVYLTVDLETMTGERFSSMSMGETGYGFLVSRSGTLLMHPNEKLIFKDISTMAWMQEVAQKKEGVLEYVFENSERVLGFSYIPELDWVVGLAADADEALAGVTVIRNTIMGIALGMMLLVALVVILVVRNMVSSLNRAVAFAQGIADGDLSQDINTTRKDELGTLERALQSMLEKLRAMIATSESKTREAEQAAEQAKQAVAAAEEARKQGEQARREGQLEAAARLESIIGRIATTSDSLTTQIEQASLGADIQRERAGEAATAMEQMNVTVIEVARNATEAAQATDVTRQEAVGGADVVFAVTEAINRVQSDSAILSKSLNTLGEQANDIGRVMSVISDIADQTNLLALNAAIEAARAGEAGRGFAVVADEVRKLAEKTMLATKEVGDAVRAIQGGTEESLQVMHTSGDSVVRSTDLSQQAGDALKRIVHLVEGCADQVRAIAAASEEQSAASEQINRGTEEISRIAAETAGAMQSSSQSVAELAEMAQQLAIMVEDLKRG